MVAFRVRRYILSGVGVLVHQQQLNVLGVVDDEGLSWLAWFRYLDRDRRTFRPLGAMWRVLRLLP